MFEWLKTASGAYNLTLIVAVVAWLISGAGIFAGFHLNKTRAIDAQHRTAKAESESVAISEKLTTTTKELEKSRARTAEVAEELARFTRPRVLTDDQKVAIRTALASAPKGKVVMTYLSVEKDAELYCRQIGTFLTELEYEVSSPPKLWLQLSLDGLYICVRDLKNPPAHAASLQAGFKAAGITVQGFGDESMFTQVGVPVAEDAFIFAVSNRN